MTTITLSEEMVAYLQELAARSLCTEDPDFCAMSFSGGNFDDAFDLGVNAGTIELARMVLTTPISQACSCPCDKCKLAQLQP